MNLIQGDCLEKMKDISDNSVDLLFCDLPYGQTSCKWDCLIDLELFWKQVNRICKAECPMFFTCSTKFGVSLINSNPKNFRYDLVWVKSAPCGFLNAKKMPMKKHEMIYVFYRKLPFYDLSSHSHKFLKEQVNPRKEKNADTLYPNRCEIATISKYDPPLPNSVIKTELYSSENKEEPRELYRNKGDMYDPPLPNSVIKTEELCKYDVNKNAYGGGKEGRIKISKNKEDHEAKYDPPLPNSVIRNDTGCYGKVDRSLTKQERNTPKLEECFGKEYLKNKPNYREINPNLGANGTDSHIYEPPLPNTLLEIKSEKGKHATQKPIGLIEWCLKYYSKEGDTILDPTMGSGTTGVACKNMNRNFIGIEKDEKIFKIAVERINS
tara:strand:+ start:499 stop:1638 length:1140 start_codon:yes stop_codon:yes gene_type:complete